MVLYKRNATNNLTDLHTIQMMLAEIAAEYESNIVVFNVMIRVGGKYAFFVILCNTCIHKWSKSDQNNW